MLKNMETEKHLHFFEFSHRKLNKKARIYKHELQHLTGDMLDIARKIYLGLSVCEGIIKALGSSDQTFKIKSYADYENYFNDLLYHLENFSFRLYAYRDKLCIFINYVMKIGYSEGDEGLLKKLVNNTQVQKYHIDTELKKFLINEISELLKTRKLMTHNVYYDHYNPYFMPDISPKDVGYYKAALAWRRRITQEVKKINDSMELIFEINEQISEKLLSYLK